jgi:DNA-binding GntR family transcriptional regulator
MQNHPSPITRRPLREDVHALLRDRIVAGQLPPGSRLQDAQLAGELGVSRTPIREALIRLADEGFVEADPNRGFSVAPLRREVILEIYPIVWALECQALDSPAPLTPPQIEELRRINAEMAAATADAPRRQECDARWHQQLVKPCGNWRLIDLLASLKQLIRRYECVYMLEPSLVRRSIRGHAEIVEALENNKPKVARRLLEQHWRAGMASLLKRLDEAGPAAGG